MQADRPKARGRLTKLSNTAIATGVHAANARLPQRSTDSQAPAASTQTQAQELTPSVRQGSDAEAPAIDSDQTIRGGEEPPVVAAHSRQSLPPAAAANGLAIQPADESIAPAQITSSDRPTCLSGEQLTAHFLSCAKQTQSAAAPGCGLRHSWGCCCHSCAQPRPTSWLHGSH